MTCDQLAMTCRTESFIFFKEGVSAIQEYERLSGDYLDDDTIVAVCDMKEAKLVHKLRLTMAFF